MTEFDIKDFKVGTNYVLEASAGTGKTYNIVQIVKKLVDARIGLDKLLIVTYTEKAAGELKDRIRKELPKENIDAASIGTIHSFCQNTLSELCVAAGKPSELTLINKGKCSDFISRYIRTEDVLSEITKYKVVMPEEDIESKLLKLFSAFLEKYYLTDDYKEDSSIVVANTALNMDHDLWDRYIMKKERIEDIYPSILTDIGILGGCSKPKMKELAGILKDEVDHQEWFDFDGRIYRSSNDMTNTETEAFKRIDGIKKEVQKLKDRGAIAANLLAAAFYQDIYQKWQEEKEKHSEQTFDDMLRSVREKVVYGGPLLGCLKDRYSYAIIDEFQDTNQKQWDIFRSVFLLNGEETDTEHHIIVVGDPKQSIYSFQGADLFVYEKAKGEITSHGGEGRILCKNFRATADVIRSTGEFFDTPAVKEHKGFDGFSASGCGNTSFRVQYDGEDVKAFWIFTDDGSEKPGDAVPYAESVCEAIADCCSYNKSGKTRLTVWDDKGKERNVTFGDFAILARTRSEMVPFVSALEKSGIPYLYYKDDSLFKGTECAHWTAILEAIDSPDFSGKNREKFRKALFTCFFGYSLAEIRSPKYDKDSVDELSLFAKWKALAFEEKWEDLIDSILTDTDVETKLGSLKDLKSLSVIRQLSDLCVDYLSAGHSLASLVTYLRNRMNGSGEEGAEDDGLVAKGTDFDCVKIMTIHASKGLEFPVVISAAGFRDPKKSETLYGSHENNIYTLSLEKPEHYDEEREDELYRLIYVAYTREKYVLMLPGCKLAKDPGKNQKESIKKRLEKDIQAFRAKGEDHYRPMDIRPVDFADVRSKVKEILERNRSTSGNGLTKKEQETVLKELKGNVFRRSSYKRAYSSLSHEKEKKETLSENGVLTDNGEEKEKVDLKAFDEKAFPVACSYDSAQKPQELPAGYPAGTGLGNALHEIFEKIDYEKAPALCADPSPNELDRLIYDCFKAQGLRSGKDPGLTSWIAATKEMITNVLGAKLPVIHGSSATGTEMTLSELSFADRRNEVEFNFNKQDQWLHNYFNGFIDLVFRKDGYYAILDWKSDRLSDDFTSYCEADPLKGHVDSQYSIQRVLYSYTLIKWLTQIYGGTEQEVFENHFGGVYYVFLRGCNKGTGNGIYAQTWDSWETLREAYDKIVAEKVRG